MTKLPIYSAFKERTTLKSTYHTIIRFGLVSGNARQLKTEMDGMDDTVNSMGAPEHKS